MRERKYVKFRVDMYEDTKFKIIDIRPERDLIHYVWSRIVILAGKVNLEGELYLSKNIPYTAETLAIEFNRDTHQIKLALEVLIELEMIELTDDYIYVVKNFAKHQNIKVKEKNKSDEKNDIKVKEIKVEENSENETLVINNKNSKDITIKNKEESVKNNDNNKLEIMSGDIEMLNITANKENTNDNSKNINTIQPQNKKNKRASKNKKKDMGSVSYDIDEDDVCGFCDDEPPMREGDRVIMHFDVNGTS